MNKKNLIKVLRKSKVLSELIGIILGDGHIHKFPRTEKLVITCDKSQSNYISHIYKLVKRIFLKAPSLFIRKKENVIDVCLYQCKISARLKIASGNKIKNNVGIPSWVFKNKRYVTACLKGLFETDGCFQRDNDNYTQYIELKNCCERIRKDTFKALLLLGYSPQLGKDYVRLARREEVYNFKKAIKFREY